MTATILPSSAPPLASDLRSSVLRTFLAMMSREVRVLRRQLITFMARTVLQPLLTVVVFFYILPSVGAGPFGGAGSTEFSTILVPGMVAMSTMMTGMMSVIFPLMMELGWTKEIADRLLAPLPTWGLALQKIAAGGLQALIAGVVVFPIILLVHAPGHAPHIEVSSWPLLIAVLVLASIAAPALGLFLGTLVDPQKMNQIFGFVMMPAAMLGCVYFPWRSLAAIPWLQYLVLINPFVYASEGLRAALTPGMPHMHTAVFLPVLIGMCVLLCALAARTFTRRVLD
ncbi:MAG: ABC transporter permease [Actinocatenispora sp.]